MIDEVVKRRWSNCNFVIFKGLQKPSHSELKCVIVPAGRIEGELLYRVLMKSDETTRHKLYILTVQLAFDVVGCCVCTCRTDPPFLPMSCWPFSFISCQLHSINRIPTSAAEVTWNNKQQQMLYKTINHSFVSHSRIREITNVKLSNMIQFVGWSSETVDSWQ